jgi:hypothetical protein
MARPTLPKGKVLLPKMAMQLITDDRQVPPECFWPGKKSQHALRQAIQQRQGLLEVMALEAFAPA